MSEFLFGGSEGPIKSSVSPVYPQRMDFSGSAQAELIEFLIHFGLRPPEPTAENPTPVNAQSYRYGPTFSWVAQKCVEAGETDEAGQETKAPVMGDWFADIDTRSPGVFLAFDDDVSPTELQAHHDGLVISKHPVSLRTHEPSQAVKDRHPEAKDQQLYAAQMPAGWVYIWPAVEVRNHEFA